MSTDTAEPAAADPTSELTVAAGSLALRASARGERVARVDDRGERMAAAREVWRALWLSRALVWLAGAGSVLALGPGPIRHAFDPPGLTRGLGRVGEILAAPAARWDAAWYLTIAHYGYRPDLGSLTAARAAFFPLYPLGVRGLSSLGLEPVLAGVLLSVVSLALGLYGLHRLTTLEVARLRRAAAAGRRGVGALVAADDTARLAVLLTAFAPMAFFFSAVYSESLYLALSVGVFLCARHGRWALAAALAALAGATRNGGVLLALPIALLYLYGPREDRPPDRPLARFPRLRYHVRGDALWLALVPVGLGLYMLHLALAGGSALEPLHAQAAWQRVFAGPFAGAWDGAKAAFEGARQLLSAQARHAYFPDGGRSPLIEAQHNLLLFAFLIAAIPAIVGVARMLPLAYSVYVLAALASPLSYPVASQPLMSLPRFLLVLFPLNIWLAVRLGPRPRARAALLIASALSMMFFVGEFSTWHWVA